MRDEATRAARLVTAGAMVRARSMPRDPQRDAIARKQPPDPPEGLLHAFDTFVRLARSAVPRTAARGRPETGDAPLPIVVPRTLIPITRELSSDTLTPVQAFLRLRRLGELEAEKNGARAAEREGAFLFESVERGERIGRWSFLGSRPFLTLSAVGDAITVTSKGARTGRAGETRSFRQPLFEAIEATLASFATVSSGGLPPLTGGAVGYLGYDTVRAIERIPDRHERDTDLPDASLAFYDTLIAFDHVNHRLVLIANAHVESLETEDLREAFDDAVQRLDRLEAALASRSEGEDRLDSLAPVSHESIAEGMRSNCRREEFEAAVARAREHIFAGDIFQVVLSQRFQKETSVDPFEVYRCLRSLNPSPYLFYLEWDRSALLGSSPEIMVRTIGRRTLVRPIAGTRRRGRTADEDLALEAELLADEKELAEHRMLVDLGRNDVGRVASFGTVKVLHREVVERYSHVMHIVSEVEGQLRDGLSAVDSFRACFPAGTVSGAPKIRAMELIDELEPTRRGIYAGAVGYLDFAGNLDTCIAIRTLQFHGGVATIQAGAGLVADSVPENEYFETIHKASALHDALRRAEIRAEARHAQGSGGTST